MILAKALAQKKRIKDHLYSSLQEPVERIQVLGISHQEKAKLVNKAVLQQLRAIKEEIISESLGEDRQDSLIILQYCASVVYLECRHLVWPYEYMALSRRVGELWEGFCNAAWVAPVNKDVKVIRPPQFSDVKATIKERIKMLLPLGESNQAIMEDVELLFELVGDINMIEDMVFTCGELPYVIDFKSGFGSNEKGNTIRLQTVGKAYRLWNNETKLLLLVRQEENNNYLRYIKKQGLWEVYCGEEAYAQIDKLTGSNMISLRKTIVNFEEDLSEKFWADLGQHLTDLRAYLKW